MYVITLCDTDSVSGEALFDGQLQFFHSAFLQQSYVKNSCPMIIGLARGREKAIELVCRIVQECMDAQKDADLVSFLARRDARIAARAGDSPGMGPDTPDASNALEGGKGGA